MPADPTPPPVPTEALEAAYDAAVTRVSEMDGWDYDDQARAAVDAAIPHLMAAGRTAAAARILGKIAEKQAEIDAPDTDAEVLSTLINECEGLWMALRAADPETFHRAHATARIAEEEAR